MIRSLRIGVILSTAAFLLVASIVHARYTFFTPEGSFTIETSLENSPWLRLPIYRSAITSLTVVGDTILGGTSAEKELAPFLFTASLSQRQVTDVFDIAEILPDQQSIASGFARVGDRVFAGTLPQTGKSAGAILKIDLVNGSIEAEVVTYPVPEEGIFALTGDARSRTLYGISYPSGLFFRYNLESDAVQVFTETRISGEDENFLGAYALSPSDYLSRRLVLDSAGRVYGSKPVSQLFRFDPDQRKIEILPYELPEVWGRSPLGRVDAWARAPDGSLYGGNAGDGQLFRLDPSTGRVTNLGKPVLMNRMKGLVFAADGNLYGAAGARPGYAHLFRYDPDGEGFRDLGNPRFRMVAPGLEQGIAWRGFQIGSMAVSEDGHYVVMGEEEALSQIMIFPVE